MKTGYHYVYRISNVIRNLHYYGVRTTEDDTIMPENDLGHYYFSSSSNKEFILEQKLHPENFKYKILKTFENRILAQKYEQKVCKRLDVKNNEIFLNRSNPTFSKFQISDKFLSVKGKRLYNNGEIEKYFKENEQPKGFILGRTSESSKKYSRKKSKEECQKIKDTHPDFKGSKHPRAKKYKIISPKGEIYEVFGGIKKKCSELNINLNLLYEYSPNPVLKKRKITNSIGWSLIKI